MTNIFLVFLRFLAGRFNHENENGLPSIIGAKDSWVWSVEAEDERFTWTGTVEKKFSLHHQRAWIYSNFAHGDIVVPSHRTDGGLRSFAVTGPSSWNALPVDLRSSSFGLDTFAKHLKTHLFGLAYSQQSTHFWVCITFCRVRHGDSVTKPDYYYYYYYYY